MVLLAEIAILHLELRRIAEGTNFAWSLQTPAGKNI